MNPNREPRTFAECVKRYEDSLESLKNVVHYGSKELLGRTPTEFEALQFRQKRNAVQDAIHRICVYRCADPSTLRAKLRWVHKFLANKDNSLGRAGTVALVQSILEQWDVAAAVSKSGNSTIDNH